MKVAGSSGSYCCWLLLLSIVALPSAAASAEPEDGEPEFFEDWEAAAPASDDPELNWLDNSQAYLTNQTQALANWMDSFFGDSIYDAEQPESILRIELEDDWNNRDGHNAGAKIRGKVYLPNLSKRVSLVFRGEEEEQDISDVLAPGQEEEDQFGLQISGRETKRSRLDYTVGWASGHIRPGIRFRHQAPLGEKTNYRFTEQIQYQHGENMFSRTGFRISHLVDNDKIVNWSSRLKYGERTQGVEWSSNISFLTRYRADHSRPIAVSYFAGASGVTRPDAYTSNYAVGLLYRRQSVRDYLFIEFEPSLNHRKLGADEDRKVMWRAIFRLEIALTKPNRRLPL